MRDYAEGYAPADLNVTVPCSGPDRNKYQFLQLRRVRQSRVIIVVSLLASHVTVNAISVADSFPAIHQLATVPFPFSSLLNPASFIRAQRFRPQIKMNSFARTTVSSFSSEYRTFSNRRFKYYKCQNETGNI